jgi:ATP-dependent RNA helicase RhlE
MSFHDLRLSKPLVRAVEAQGYTEPTPIQADAIPPALEGRDVLGCAKTGTGKTGAFALPILHRLSSSEAQQTRPSRKRSKGRAPRALVLCPTRELAMQIMESFVTYGRELSLQHTVVFGGVSQYHQVKALRAGIDVLVATPGRLLDLVNQGHIDLSEIQSLVLDEADRMLDMGFVNDIRKIVAMLPKERQALLFSATLSKNIRVLSDSILRDPISIQSDPESTTVDAITQQLFKVEKNSKQDLLKRFLRRPEVSRALVFTRTKHGADRLSTFLRRASINSDAIHGNKTQNARTKAMDAFRRGRVSVLIATDVASRGIDVDDISHVINFDMPIDPETYVHRIGRTARAGSTGIAVSFCTRDERRLLRSIERRTGVRIDVIDQSQEPDIAASETEASAARTGADRDRPHTDRKRDRSEQPRTYSKDRSDKFSKGSRGKSKHGNQGKNEYTNDRADRPVSDKKVKPQGWSPRPDDRQPNRTKSHDFESSSEHGGGWNLKAQPGAPYQPKGNASGSPSKPSPQAKSGEWKPQAKSGEWKPKAKNGEWKPKAKNGEWKPKAKNGEWKPKAKSGEWKPKAKNGEWKPKAKNGEWTPKAKNGEWKPKAKNGEWKPKAKNGEWKPKAKNGEWKPKAKNGEWKPKAKNGEWTPKAKNGEWKPKPKSGGWKPKSDQRPGSPRGSNGASADSGRGRKSRGGGSFAPKRSGPGSRTTRHPGRLGRGVATARPTRRPR